MADGAPRTLFDKVWEAHVVRPETAETPATLYVDPLVHSHPPGCALLRERGLRPAADRRGDHGPLTPTPAAERHPIPDAEAAAQVRALESAAPRSIPLHALGSAGRASCT
jgi:3-isopropylmalate/(R)-2-methylmalate dehydratase large subunit